MFPKYTLDTSSLAQRERLIVLIDNLERLYTEDHDNYLPHHLAHIELVMRSEQDYKFEAWLWREWLDRAYPQDAGSNAKPEQNDLQRQAVNVWVSKV